MAIEKKVRVAVGMSGGVDSSVAAALLKREGYDVIGITMRIWDGKKKIAAYAKRKTHTCFGPEEEEDIEDARKAARILGIPYYVINLPSEYSSIVLSYFKSEYLSGRTPNPCVICNQKVKFGALVEKARRSGLEFDYFATGHYARVQYDKKSKRYMLKKGIDPNKDQSYGLAFLSQKQLSEVIFPLGKYTKQEVRKMAAEFGLNTSLKPESQDFYSGDYKKLLGAKEKKGPVLDKEGRKLGEHCGIWCYTVGQRRGLGITARKPLYVTEIDEKKNAVVVGEEKDLYVKKFVVGRMNWVALGSLKKQIKMMAKVRYRQREGKALVSPLKEGKFAVEFDEPQKAIAPGQIVVFYKKDVVMGGGIIERLV